MCMHVCVCGRRGVKKVKKWAGKGGDNSSSQKHSALFHKQEQCDLKYSASGEPRPLALNKTYPLQIRHVSFKSEMSP